MSNWSKRFWAIVLTAILLLNVFPAAVGAQGPDDGEQDEPRVFTQADDQLLEDDVFAKIEAVTAPPSGGSGKCKWCGEDHTANFWQRIVGFWHTIFYFWAHLFGLR